MSTDFAFGKLVKSTWGRKSARSRSHEHLVRFAPGAYRVRRAGPRQRWVSAMSILTRSDPEGPVTPKAPDPEGPARSDPEGPEVNSYSV